MSIPSTFLAAPPESVPAMDVNPALGGSLVLGLILATVIIVKWKSNVYKAKEKQAIIITAITCVLLAGAAGGLIGSLMTSVQQTGDQVGTTITQVGTGGGPGGGTVSR